MDAISDGRNSTVTIWEGDTVTIWESHFSVLLCMQQKCVFTFIFQIIIKDTSVQFQFI